MVRMNGRKYSSQMREFSDYDEAKEEAMDAEAREPVATAPPRGGPRPSWYVRVRGGPTRGEPSLPTGSTGAAPPYTCGALARLRSSRRAHVANPQDHRLGLLPQRLLCSGLW